MKEQKAIVRQQVREHLSAISEDQHLQFSRRIVDHAQQFLSHRQLSVVGLFLPLRDEPDITPLIHWCLERGWGVALPWIAANANRMEMRAVRHLDRDVEPGPFGILQPRPVQQIVPPSELDYIFLPGRAFDLRGRRIGRGKGFYDRFLTRLRKECVRVGIAFRVQVLDQIPSGQNDQSVDIIITEKGILKCSGREGDET